MRVNSPIGSAIWNHGCLYTRLIDTTEKVHGSGMHMTRHRSVIGRSLQTLKTVVSWEHLATQTVKDL